MTPNHEAIALRFCDTRCYHVTKICPPLVCDQNFIPVAPPYEEMKMIEETLRYSLPLAAIVTIQWFCFDGIAL